MEIKFANNASTRLANSIKANSLEIVVTSSTGQLFPVLTEKTDYFKVTLVNPGNGEYEILKVTEVTGDTFTVERAQEGTVAKAFPQNTVVENRLTAGSIQAVLNDVDSTTTTAGRVRIATEQEVADGVVNDACVTPANSRPLRMMPGTIVIFSGIFDREGYPIDSGTGKARKDWHKCDGTFNTPDLQDRFIVGSGQTFPYASSGGAKQYTFEVEVLGHKLTIDEMPKHSHRVSNQTGRNTEGTWLSGWSWGDDIDTSEVGGDKPHTHDTKVTTPEAILPPYYALAYIMKIA